MADLTLATKSREAIPDLPVAHRADRTLLALDLGASTRLGAAWHRRADHQRNRVLPLRSLRWWREALSPIHQLADRDRPAVRSRRRHLVRGTLPVTQGPTRPMSMEACSPR